MLHISQIAEEKIENISDVLKVGQKIDDARVVNLNRELGKVSVSLRAETKRATPLVSLNVGDEVQGKIVRLKQYGAFIDVGCKRNALLHISRMSIHKVDAITDFANVGETVNVRVIRVDSDNKNIAVSMLSPESDKFVDRRDRQRERMTVWQQVVDAGEDDDLDNLISELLNLDRVIHDEFFESLGNPRTLEV